MRIKCCRLIRLIWINFHSIIPIPTLVWQFIVPAAVSMWLPVFLYHDHDITLSCWGFADFYRLRFTRKCSGKGVWVHISALYRYFVGFGLTYSCKFSNAFLACRRPFIAWWRYFWVICILSNLHSFLSSLVVAVFLAFSF